MSADVLKVAVVGHTNTGKTSLLRTLTRDVGFGEVSDRPAVTRHVEGATLDVDGVTVVELYDTPGLEDSIGLLDVLDDLRADRRDDDLANIEQFLDSPAAASRYGQEAKSIRQVLNSHAAMYVIDARDRVLGKHRDELEILRRCARPVIAVLNFVAGEDANTDQWREHLSRVGIHSVAEFDTVVVDDHGEERLFEKMRTLLDGHRDTIERLMIDRRAQRTALRRASARLAADLLIDAAAFVVYVPAEETARTPDLIEAFKQRVRDRERRAMDDMLSLHRFRLEDVDQQQLAIEGAQFGLDLFSPEAMKVFGVHAGGGAAAGALAGLTVDAMLGGLSLGAATAVGAAIGAVMGAGTSKGKQLVRRARGLTELRCDDPTLMLLQARQVTLIRTLLTRGHGAVTPVAAKLRKRDDPTRTVAATLLAARQRPHWSTLGDDEVQHDDSARAAAVESVADLVLQQLHVREGRDRV